MAPKVTPPATINITELPSTIDDDQSVFIAASPMYSYINPLDETNKNMLAVTIENIEIKKRMAKIEKAMEILIRGSGK